MLLEPILKEIADWLSEERNRDEFIILYLDISVNIKKRNQEKQLVDLLENYFSPFLLVNNASSIDSQSLQDAISQNHRVFIATRRPLSIPSTFIFSTSSQTCCHWKEFDISLFCHRNGSIRWEQEYLAGKVNLPIYYSRIVTNQLRYGPLSKDFLPFPSPTNFYPANIHSLYSMGVNSLAADYLSNEQIQQHFWVWNPDVFSTYSFETIAASFEQFCVFMNATSPSWLLRNCGEVHPVLCQHSLYHEVFVVGKSLSHPESFIPFYHSPNQRNVSNPCPAGFGFKPPMSL